MKRTTASVMILAAFLCAQPSSGAADEKSFDQLRGEIEALRPGRHAWREIAWKTCPLEALNAARAEKKPLLVWVFLGVPTDERC